MRLNVSVLLPVYNGEAYIAEAVGSVLGQSIGDFELVVVDDGSTDRSREIVERFARQDSRVRLISRPNTGLVKALNDGLEHCRGEFVARMDADDVSLPQRLEVQQDYLRGQTDCVVVGSRVLLIDEEGEELGLSKTRYRTHEEIDAAHLRGEFAIMHPSAMIRTAALRAVGGYREWPIGEDYDLWLRLGEVGRLANLSEPLLKYRWVLASYSHERRANTQDVRRQILAEALQRREMEADLPDKKAASAVSPSLFARRCSEKALAHGNKRTGRKHALRSLRLEPASLDAWRLAMRACVGEGVKHALRPVVRVFYR